MATVSALRVLPGGRSGNEPGPAVPADRGLLAELYEKHAASVYGRCRYLLRNDDEAKDALQEVFAKALRALPEFRAAASPSTWILRIATHYCLNLHRSRRAAWREELVALGKDRRVESEPPERRELVRVLVGAAPQEAQEAAVLYYVDEMTQAEIAQELGRSLPTVRKRLREFLACARKALAESLQGIELPEGDEP
jgi:RNA polymerase sigma-70 factor (ECF subfamily)